LFPECQLQMFDELKILNDKIQQISTKHD